MQETAYAKINLALHVRGRCDDGYHDIETVFAFCEDGDVLTVEPVTFGGPGDTELCLSITGFTTVIVCVLFLGGVQLICVGILGEYIGRIYEEVKRRPLYVVRSTLGLDRPVD